jgi:hypothetical protein
MSNPSAAIPNYPLSEREATFFAAAGVVRKTGSYPMERALAVAGHAGMFAGALIVGIGLTVGASYIHKVAAGIVFLALCLGLVFGLLPYVEKRFWAMRAAFAYLVTEMLVRGKPSPTTNASGMAQDFLTQQFGDLGPIAEAHNQVQRIVSSFFKTFDKLDAMLPIDLGPVRKAMAWVTDKISPRIADLALSFAIARGDRDFTEASKDAVAYVAQNPKPIIGTAIRAYITEKVIGGTIGFIFMSIGFAAVFAIVNSMAGDAAATSGMPTEGAQTVGIFAAGFSALLVGIPVGALASWFIRTAFIEPIALTMLIIRFHATIQGQAVDPAMRARIQSASGELREARGVMSFLD